MIHFVFILLLRAITVFFCVSNGDTLAFISNLISFILFRNLLLTFKLHSDYLVDSDYFCLYLREVIYNFI